LYSSISLLIVSQSGFGAERWRWKFWFRTQWPGSGLDKVRDDWKCRSESRIESRRRHSPT